MRYHVFSLVAVFLALGIGILLGTTLVERGLIAEQKAQIGSLRTTFDEIKEKNAELNEDLSAFSRYSDESRPYMISNMLPGRGFAVLCRMEPDEGALASINDGIAAAGGSVPFVLELAGTEAYNESVVANLVSLFQLPGGAQEMKQRVFEEVFAQLNTASNAGIFTTLEQLGVVKVRGSLSAPVSGTVLLGPVEIQSIDKTDSPLVNIFTSAGYPLVGVTGTRGENSVLIFYKRRGISTVDHVDTVPGQVALDMVLSGKAGNFGSGGAATRMLPAP
jgi:hypothetical protein